MDKINKKKFIVYGGISLLISTLIGVACGLKISDISGLLTMGGLLLVVLADQIGDDEAN